MSKDFQLHKPLQKPSPGPGLGGDRKNIVFLTVRTKDRIPWLADPKIHSMFRNACFQAAGWLVGNYLMMPDHVHLCCCPGTLRIQLGAWLAYLKRVLFRQHRNPAWRFQSRGWHHQLMTDSEWESKWIHVQQNPVRSGLVSKPEDWPYKGRIFEF